jgi:hypothetical protein
MPASIERKIRARGGVIRYRSAKHGGKLFRVAVVRKKGPRGGRTIEWPVRKKKSRIARLGFFKFR